MSFIDGIVLPKGASVLVPILHIQRNPVYWVNPLKFDPDRFLPEEAAKRHPYTYLPFSAGPRNCVATKYAPMAMKTMVATIVRRFHLSTPYKSVNDVNLKSYIVLRPVDGFLVSLRLR